MQAPSMCYGPRIITGSPFYICFFIVTWAIGLGVSLHRHFSSFRLVIKLNLVKFNFITLDISRLIQIYGFKYLIIEYLY